LLARWTEFAQAAVALPKGAEGARWREAVPAVIALQAVTMALGEVERLPEGELALAVDRSEVLITRHGGAAHRAWQGATMPESMRELLHDAHAALARARSMGVEWVVEVERLEMPGLHEWLGAVVEGGFEGEVLGAPAGTVLFGGEPALFARPTGIEGPAGLALRRRVSVPRQVFRQVSEDGARVERDLVVPMDASLVPGRPLLVPMVEGRRVLVQRDDAGAARWREAQQRALSGSLPPVEFR